MNDVSIVPITQKAAKVWIDSVHRHLGSPVGDLFRVGLTVDGQLRAVGMAGRPCRALQDGRTVQIDRIAADAEPVVNACSRIYGALRRIGFAMGYLRFVTYTLEHEPGTSLRAAGFHFDGLTDGGEWDRPSRRRVAAAQAGRKRRWIYPGRDSGLWDGVNPGAMK